MDQDDLFLAPFTTVRSRLKASAFDKVDVIFCSARSAAQMADASEEIRQLLKERHHIGKGDVADFDVQTAMEIANMLGAVMGALTALLASIAGIALVVGGVGIMNIMLVSVTERTREIGIRMAIGARPGDILRQFLIESVLLSVAGGVVGLLFGIAASIGITLVINTLTPGTHWPIFISMILAIGQSGAIEDFDRPLAALTAEEPARVNQGQLDVLDCAASGEQIEVLEDGAEFLVAEVGPPFPRHAGDLLAVEEVASVRWNAAIHPTDFSQAIAADRRRASCRR